MLCLEKVGEHAPKYESEVKPSQKIPSIKSKTHEFLALYSIHQEITIDAENQFLSMGNNTV